MSAPPEKGKAKDEKDKGKEETRNRTSQHSNELISAFSCIRGFLTAIGQMPYKVKHRKDGTCSFKLKKLSFRFLIYLLIVILTTCTYLMVSAGIVTFVLNTIFQHHINPQYTVIVKDKTTGESETLKWERYIVRHEMVAIIVVWSWQTVAMVGSFFIIFSDKYYVHYMNYFNRVVQLMDMDMTAGVRSYVFTNNLLSTVVVACLVFGFVLGLIFPEFTAVVNTSSAISNFILRLCKIEMEQSKYKIWYQILGLLIVVYALLASRANIIQFLFFSHLLKNGSKIWNERLRKVLNPLKKEISQSDDDQVNRRLEPKKVHKDHLMMVQLFQMTENVFGTILFAYYSLTIIAVVMEVYQLAALQGFAQDAYLQVEKQQGLADAAIKKSKLIEDRKGSDSDADVGYEHEILATAGVSILLLLQNVLFCYRTTRDAARAYESAMEGFHILRIHGLMYCQTKTDRNFVLSLYYSFSKNNPLQLTASGYFAINRVLLVTMASTVVNWAISIYQTKVDQWK